MTPDPAPAPALDPAARALLDAARASGLPPVSREPLDVARERMRRTHVDGGLPQVPTRDAVVPGPAGGIPVRWFEPDGLAADPPVLLFLHGGGWVLDDVDTHARLCGALALAAGVAVVSVEYRRAPEHPHPAALDDALAVFRSLAADRARRGGAGPIAIGGDSAGGNLAAAASLVLRDSGETIPDAQLLLYPVLALPGEHPSYVERGTGYSLDADFMTWAFDAYAPDVARRDDVTLAPLHAADLAGLPPALVATAEFDPLRDEGLAYVERLRASGVPVRAWHAADQMHGFAMRLVEIPRAAALVDTIGGELGTTLRALAATSAARTSPRSLG